jgi:NAD+ kinase
MTQPGFSRIGIVGKADPQGLHAPLARLLSLLATRNCTTVLDPCSASACGQTGVPLNELAAQVDLCVVLGGDGTLLNATRVLAPHAVPLIGINLGRLGFLTDIPAKDLEDRLGQVLDGHYALEDRTLLAARLTRSDGVEVSEAMALNDVVVAKGARGSMIEVEVFVDGNFVYNLRADGLILATPTGSTAYALSSGGPIVHPGLKALLLTPICPHTLSNRPVVLQQNAQVEMILHKGTGVFASFDVQDQVLLDPGDRLNVTCAQQSVHLIHPPGYDYFAMLREKLRWGTRF